MEKHASPDIDRRGTAGGRPPASPPSIAIRRATEADNHRIASVGRQAFVDSFAADNHPDDMAAYLDQAFGPDIQAAELADPASTFLIAQVGSRVVGYAHLRESPPPPCVRAPHSLHLSRFYAVQAWIGRGVGPILMDACIAAGGQRGVGGIWLGVWEKNERAIRFYRKRGFELRGTQTFVLGSDRQTDLVMWLPMAESAAASRNDRQPDRMA